MSEYMAAVNGNVAKLRARLRAGAPHVFASMPARTSRFTGEAFVETVGTILRFDDGMPNFFYEREALSLRARSIRNDSGRNEFFSAIGAQMRGSSTVLNVGAGGDIALIDSVARGGLRVISTDLAEDTVMALAATTTHPTFACDLAYLPQVLPKPVDYVVGNSVLGYLEPGKVSGIVKNLWDSLRLGAVFTFDLSPHPEYFLLTDEEKVADTVVNPAEADPSTLLKLIERYGVSDGLGAMAFLTHYRAVAVHLAVIDSLRAEFARHGARCTAGHFRIRGPASMPVPVYTLRVSKDDDSLLQPVTGEDPIGDVMEYWHRSLDGDAKPYFVLWCIDRESGEALARRFGIHRDARADPWLVAQHVATEQDSSLLSKGIRDEALGALAPDRCRTRLQPYLEGMPLLRRQPLREVVMIDQVLHKTTMARGQWSAEDERNADEMIDAAYAREAKRAQGAPTLLRAQEKRERRAQKRTKQ